MKRSLTRHERLKSRTDIKRLFSSAKSVSMKGMRLLFLDNSVGHNRILVTLTKKYGNAVQRNRAKRVLREIYRDIKYKLIQGYDIGVIIYPIDSKDSGEYDYHDRYKQFRSLLKKAGILNETHQ